MNLSQQIAAVLHSPRIVAFLVHLSVSVVFITAVLAVIYWVWFPHALAVASGGLEGLLIIVGVDVTLGPLLTLIVYDTTTKRWHVLRRDLAIIASLQLASLAAGVGVVYHARPLAVVHLYNAFHVLRQQDFDAFKINSQPLENFPGTYPKIFYVTSEKNYPAFMAKQILDGLNKATPQYLRIDLYQVMPRDKSQIKRILKQPQAGNLANCMLQNIASAYTSGRVCFHIDKFIFTDFIAGESVSYIEPGASP